MPENEPQVYKSVRAVGTFRPKFGPSLTGQVFSDELNVIGTAFWLKEHKVLITCAHVIQNLLGAPLELAGLLVVGNAGNYRRAVIEIMDLAHDLAVLKLLGTNNQPISGAELDQEAADGLVLVDSYPPIAAAVSYVGFPFGNQLLNQVHSPTYAEGVIGIQKRDTGMRREIQISGGVVGGFSGAPVVLKDSPDHVVGVLSNGPSPNEQAGTIFLAISWEHVVAIAKLARS
jgi:hypothetical protein